jgi:CRP-like cAMP-binding protein
MSDAEISMLTEQLRQEHYSPGKVIIRQGDPGDKFYIIWQGHVEVSQVDEDGISKVVNQLARGDYFGELALLSDAPRNATCKATIPTVVLTLSRVDFDQLVRERFAMRDKLGDSIAKAESLRRIPLFEEMDGFQIQHIASELRDRTYMPGEIIIQQDEIGEHFYVIKSGKVRIFITQDGK